MATQGMAGDRIYYEFEPLAGRPVLMLSNSLGTNLSMWSPQMELLRRLRATSSEGYSASCAAVRDMDQRADLHRISAPTLVIFGTQDEVTPPSAAAELLAGITGSLPLPLDAAHLANAEAADAFTQGVSNFLSQN